MCDAMLNSRALSMAKSSDIKGDDLSRLVADANYWRRKRIWHAYAGLPNLPTVNGKAWRALCAWLNGRQESDCERIHAAICGDVIADDALQFADWFLLNQNTLE